MEVRVKTIPEFDRRAKRLAKKYKSLKSDLQQLVSSFSRIQRKETLLATMFIKFVSPLLPKAMERVVEEAY